MSAESIQGRVHSIQSLGTVDGPGVRFVVFLQGCPLRCGCCHNPDTWHPDGGTAYTAAELAARAGRYREYFGREGGITVSGGEPLLQARFVSELFALCHERGISTCLDTSGCLLNGEIKALLASTDRVLLDIKYTSEALYREHVGCELSQVLSFLRYLDEQRIPTTVRQVILPPLNADEASARALRELVDRYRCVDKVELLPFKKICAIKYEELGIPFKFASLPTPDAETMRRLNAILQSV